MNDSMTCSKTSLVSMLDDLVFVHDWII